MTRRRGLWKLCVLKLSRHWGVAVLLACAAVLRAATMMGYRPALVFIDTSRYLLKFALGIDPLGYRYLFLRPMIDDLHAGLADIVAVQHLLGLAMGAALYALVLAYGGPRWLGVLVAAPVLLDAYQLQAEQLIMSDVLFEAFLCAALLVVLWPPARKWLLARVAVAALLLGLATTVRQVGELALIPLLAYAVLSRPSFQARARLALVTLAVFAAPVLCYMAFSANVLGAGFSLSRMESTYLYARLANAADCAALRVPASERALCPDGAKPGVDALANGVASPLRTFSPPPGASRAALIDQFDLAVVVQQPFRVANAVVGDAVKLFALTRDQAPGDLPISDSQFQTSYPVFQPAYGAVFGPEYRAAFGQGTAKPRTDPEIDKLLRWYQLHGGYAPGPLMLVFALLSAFGALSPRSPRKLRTGAAVMAGFTLAVLGGADMYEFVWRYQLPALVLLPPGGALGTLAVADTVERYAQNRWTPGRPPAGPIGPGLEWIAPSVATDALADRGAVLQAVDGGNSRTASSES